MHYFVLIELLLIVEIFSKEEKNDVKENDLAHGKFFFFLIGQIAKTLELLYYSSTPLLSLIYILLRCLLPNIDYISIICDFVFL